MNIEHTDIAMNISEDVLDEVLSQDCDSSGCPSIDLLGGKIKLLQPQDGFRASLDSVMVAAACPAQDGDRVLDMGCGAGSASFCLLYRVNGCYLCGVDIQESCVKMAAQNAVLNNVSERSDFVHCDINQFEVSRPDERFDHIICNPPYLETGTYLTSPTEEKAIALGHRDQDVSIEVWIKHAHRLLKSRGSLTLIQRSDMLDDIIQAMGKRFGKIDVIPLWPKTGKISKRVIIRAVKDRRSPLTMYPGIVLHEEDGSYTAQANEILKEAGSLAL